MNARTSVGLLLTVMCSTAAMAQGTINFSNIGHPDYYNPDAPFFEENGTTPLRGTSFRAALYAAAPGTAESELRIVGTAVSFLTGTGAGYFVGPRYILDGSAQVNGVLIAPGSLAAFQVRFWRVANGSTWEDAFASGSGYGMSHVFTNITGGAGSPPSPPGELTGLGKGTRYFLVPEPGTVTMCTLAGVVLFGRVACKRFQRKNKRCTVRSRADSVSSADFEQISNHPPHVDIVNARGEA